MNTLKNKVQLIGYLGNDPVLTELDGGIPVTRFLLVTKCEGEPQRHPVVARGPNAPILSRHLSKGSEVAIEGSLSQTTDENDRYLTHINCKDFLILPNKK